MTAAQTAGLPDDGEWIDHAAGPCPVHPRALIKVQLRFELGMGRDEGQLPRKAGAWDADMWEHRGDPTMHIVAFRFAGAA